MNSINTPLIQCTPLLDKLHNNSAVYGHMPTLQNTFLKFFNIFVAI